MRIQGGGLYATVFTSVLVLGACARHHGEGSPTASAADSGSESSDADAAPPQDDQAAHVGASASVIIEALADSEIHGEGTFTETAQGVDLELHVHGCAGVNDATSLPLAILQGGDCSDATLLGARWDSPRGDDIPPATCVGASGGGHTFYTRQGSDDKPWSVGTPDASNVIGHAFVVYDPQTLKPGGCGVISRAEDRDQAPPPPTGGGGPSEEARAVIGGLCLGRMIVRDNAQACPNPRELNACAQTHCDVDACLKTCADYTACLDQQKSAGTDICQASLVQCQITAECSACTGDVNQCVFGFCLDQLGCAAPVLPSGPCSKLEACCNMQGDAEAQACLDTVHMLEKLSGDPSCYGAMRDWDTTAHLKVPCMFR